MPAFKVAGVVRGDWYSVPEIRAAQNSADNIALGLGSEMMTKINLAMVQSLCVISLSILLSSCARIGVDVKTKEPNAEVRLIYDKDFFGDDINLVIVNHSDRPLCFPLTAISPTSKNFTLRQNGAVVTSQRGESRESIKVNGIDIAEGLAVVPAAKKRNFYINIGDFALDGNKFTASVQLDVLDCAELFSAAQPQRRTLQASTTGSLPIH